MSGDATISSIGVWASDPQTHFIFGTLFVVLVAALNILGLKAYLRFQDINWIIGNSTGLLLIVIFLFAPDGIPGGLRPICRGDRYPD